MAHYLILFVGTRENLKQVYDNHPLCLGENRTEELFGYDYLAEYTIGELLKYCFPGHYSNGSSYEFTKLDTEAYNVIIREKNFWDCYDIRDNTANHRLTEEMSKDELREFFVELPEDTHFFVCLGHQ